MEVHVPKAARSLREFAVELMTIVSGIVIAISLEQGVEALHWRHKVEIAREALRRELADTTRFYAIRVAANECVGRRLAELQAITEAAAEHRPTDPVGDLTLHLGSLLADDVWQSERAAQTLVHFPETERDLYSRTYSQQIDIRSWENEELHTWAAIRLLEGNPARLAATDLTLVRQNIQLARTLNYLIALNAKEQLSRSAALGIAEPQLPTDDPRGLCKPLARASPTRPYTEY